MGFHLCGMERSSISEGQTASEANRLRRSALGPPGLDETLIRRVVDRFYAAARKDEVIGPIFNHAVGDDGWPAHLAAIADFWSSMLLGSGRYGGRPMPKHLAIPDLDNRHFQRWLALFRRTVEAECPPDLAALFVDRSERIANSFRMNIKMHRGEDIVSLRPLEREPEPFG